jgi:hypothetical protein
LTESTTTKAIRQAIADGQQQKSKTTLAAGKNMPTPEETFQDNINAVRFMLRLAHFTGKRGLKAACYVAAGHHLAELRKGRDREGWADIVQRECPVSVRRAYQLMAIAAGKKPLAELRSETAARRRKNYRRKTKA